MEDCLFPKSNDRQVCSGAFRQINRMSVILRFSLHQFYTIFINQYLEKTWFDIIAKTQRRRVQDRYKEYDGIYLGHYIQYFFWFFCGVKKYLYLLSDKVYEGVCSHHRLCLVLPYLAYQTALCHDASVVAS